MKSKGLGDSIEKFTKATGIKSFTQVLAKNGIFGKKFKSIANRALMFDPSIIHQSTTCTDKDFRALLVLNYS